MKFNRKFLFAVLKNTSWLESNKVLQTYRMKFLWLC